MLVKPINLRGLFIGMLMKKRIENLSGMSFIKKSKSRINSIIEGKLSGAYGLGSERTIEDYRDTSGIDIRNKKIVEEDSAFTFKKHLNDNWTNAKKKGSIFDVFK